MNGEFLPSMAALLPTIGMEGEFGLITIAALLAVMFVVELAFYMIPGISFSSLLLATAAMYVGFIPTFLVSVVAINAAHFIWKRDISIFLPNFITLLPIVGFATFFGPAFIDLYGWGLFGVAMGLVKWGTALPIRLLFGKNVAKRTLNLVLEPPINFLIFWKLNALFLFLF